MSQMLLFKRDGYYHVEYFDETLQKMRRKSLKTKNKSEALRNLSEFKDSLVKKQKHTEKFLSEFREEYIDFVRQSHSHNYLRSVQLAIKKLNAYLNKDVLLSELQRSVCEKFLLQVFGKSKYAAHLYLRTLKAAMNKAISWEYIDSNPFKGIKLPKIPKKYPVFITAVELEVILENINEKDIRDIVTIGFYTGMRLSEILFLKWGAINFENDMITVQNHESFITKSKREREIPIHEKVE